jgi:hypothetical protein
MGATYKEQKNKYLRGEKGDRSRGVCDRNTKPDEEIQ